MPHSRFHRLPLAQREALLDAAFGEFAAHGRDSASLNRIISAAGLSKGSLYYYFDGKDDLYAEVVRVRLEQLFGRLGPLSVPDAADAEGFWTQVEELYLRLMTALLDSADVARLLRNWLESPSPAHAAAERAALEDALPWLRSAIAAGQEVGTIRTDVPLPLLLEIVMGMGRAMDAWLVTRPEGGADLGAAVHLVIQMMRGAVAPPADSGGAQAPNE